MHTATELPLTINAEILSASSEQNRCLILMSYSC